MAQDDINLPDNSAVWPPPPIYSLETATLAPDKAFVSGSPLARKVVVGLGVNIVTEILALITDPIRSTVGQMAGGVVAILQVVALVSTAVLFLRWTHRMYKNLSSFGTQGLSTTPGWAVGYFFVPVISLYKPLNIFGEIWRASDPEVSNTESLAWQNGRVPGLLAVWWVVNGFLDRAVFSQSYQDSKGGSDPVLSMASDVLGIISAVLAIRVVRLISARHDAKHMVIAV